MKIARLLEDDKETYGFVKNDYVATKEQLTHETGVPLPFNFKDFIFDGWYDEIKNKVTRNSYKEKLSNFKILAPISNPSKIKSLKLMGRGTPVSYVN